MRSSSLPNVLAARTSPVWRLGREVHEASERLAAQVPRRWRSESSEGLGRIAWHGSAWAPSEQLSERSVFVLPQGSALHAGLQQDSV